MSDKETQARQPVAFTLGAEQYALSDQASAQARRQAADTANLVAQVASWTRLIADTVEAGGPGFADLAAAVDALASQARSAARAIDGCLTTANRYVTTSATAGLAPCAYHAAVRLTALLEQTLDAAVVIYGAAHSELADRACVAEERLLDTLPQPCTTGLSAVTLAARARSLSTPSRCR